MEWIGLVYGRSLQRLGEPSSGSGDLIWRQIKREQTVIRGTVFTDRQQQWRLWQSIAGIRSWSPCDAWVLFRPKGRTVLPLAPHWSLVWLSFYIHNHGYSHPASVCSEQIKYVVDPAKRKLEFNLPLLVCSVQFVMSIWPQVATGKHILQTNRKMHKG